MVSLFSNGPEISPPHHIIKLTLGVSVTQGLLPHVAQPDGALAAAVHKLVAVYRVEDGGRDHLRQLLHVGGLDVHNVWGEGELRGHT